MLLNQMLDWWKLKDLFSIKVESIALSWFVPSMSFVLWVKPAPLTINIRKGFAFFPSPPHPHTILPSSSLSLFLLCQPKQFLLNFLIISSVFNSTICYIQLLYFNLFILCAKIKLENSINSKAAHKLSPVSLSLSLSL